jgi:hypothetical protein
MYVKTYHRTLFYLSRALLLDLSDNNRKHAQNNTVVVQQEEMDRVGVEPTTSACSLKPRPTYIHLKAASMEEEFTVQIPPAPPFLSILRSPVLSSEVLRKS